MKSGKQLLFLVTGCLAALGTARCGDDFAKDLKIPADLNLAEPETVSEAAQGREHADDEVFAAALADPGDPLPLRQEAQALCRRAFGEKHKLAVAYFRKNKLWHTWQTYDSNARSGYVFKRTYRSGDQYCDVSLTALPPFDVDCEARRGCRLPEAGCYAAMTDLCAELRRVVSLGGKREIDGILTTPKKYVPAVKPDFTLINGMQGGIYHYEATVTPGEDGKVYLRAYEVTKGTRLSAMRMRRCTLEEVAGKGEQLIGIGRKFTIYEGEDGQYYAARLEIWFEPASGGEPRKLKEKLFRVQGWSF